MSYFCVLLGPERMEGFNKWKGRKSSENLTSAWESEEEGPVGFLLFLQPTFGYLLQPLPANMFYKLLEGKIVEIKITKFSHVRQISLTSFRDTNEYEY